MEQLVDGQACTGQREVPRDRKEVASWKGWKKARGAAVPSARSWKYPR